MRLLSVQALKHKIVLLHTRSTAPCRNIQFLWYNLNRTMYFSVIRKKISCYSMFTELEGRDIVVRVLVAAAKRPEVTKTTKSRKSIQQTAGKTTTATDCICQLSHDVSGVIYSQKPDNNGSEKNIVLHVGCFTSSTVFSQRNVSEFQVTLLQLFALLPYLSLCL